MIFFLMLSLIPIVGSVGIAGILNIIVSSSSSCIISGKVAMEEYYVFSSCLLVLFTSEA